jgi:hypothetical protein
MRPETSGTSSEPPPGDARTITITVYTSTGVSTSVGSLFRVRALGPGGVSEGTIISIMQRGRAVRH